MAYRITVESVFSSAHNLRHYKGKCEELHGHNWKVEAVVLKEKLDKTGMVMDFKLLKGHLNRVLDKLDHKYLNSLSFFKKVNPTSENLAKYIYDSIKTHISELKEVTVWENSTSCATYEE